VSETAGRLSLLLMLTCGELVYSVAPSSERSAIPTDRFNRVVIRRSRRKVHHRYGVYWVEILFLSLTSFPQCFLQCACQSWALSTSPPPPSLQTRRMLIGPEPPSLDAPLIFVSSTCSEMLDSALYPIARAISLHRVHRVVVRGPRRKAFHAHAKNCIRMVLV